MVVNKGETIDLTMKINIKLYVKFLFSLIDVKRFGFSLVRAEASQCKKIQ